VRTTRRSRRRSSPGCSRDAYADARAIPAGRSCFALSRFGVQRRAEPMQHNLRRKLRLNEAQTAAGILRRASPTALPRGISRGAHKEAQPVALQIQHRPRFPSLANTLRSKVTGSNPVRQPKTHTKILAGSSVAERRRQTKRSRDSTGTQIVTSRAWEAATLPGPPIAYGAPPHSPPGALPPDPCFAFPTRRVTARGRRSARQSARARARDRSASRQDFWI